MSYKKQTKGLDPIVYSGSAAVQVEESFDYFREDQFNQFLDNLENLENKVSRLAFMMKEIQDIMALSKPSL